MCNIAPLRYISFILTCRKRRFKVFALLLSSNFCQSVIPHFQNSRFTANHVIVTKDVQNEKAEKMFNMK